ncbi:argininosuccinate lyase [Peribacillus simplex]|uniref:argininosuccinate lyase n=1 Tax=Peribacillus TaxID=2675229 RepID=UPI000F632ED9|nr:MULTISPECIES: lyase family protein [Peribacillus]MDF1999857.1 lyase family protein [Peribacillus frigoritolerans]RRN69526.1 argininosuccinate lyase [Peribacillus simplex]
MQMTGRVKEMPHETLEKLILYPQFDFEVNNYLKQYASIEKVLVKAYKQMGFIDDHQAFRLVHAIDQLNLERLKENTKESLTDIALTIEKEIDKNLGAPIDHWHLDRSRNDFQACSQLMYAREKWINLINKVFSLNKTVLSKAAEHTRTMMPGYTHFQSAQIISAGFYLTAVSIHLGETGKKMLQSLERMNRSCPLGSGAMSGQEYEWDLKTMAHDLGFDSYVGHALTGVASRDWVLDMGSALSFFASNMSRFLTDLMNWGSSEYRFINFSDELTGISSSMPQKRNFPLLERIRGKTSHLISIYQDFLIGQRNTPYSNMVEVSKESTSSLPSLFKHAEDVLDLLNLMFGHLEFNVKIMEQRCLNDFYGGFTLANRLTKTCGIPYRKAQVISGRFITESIAEGYSPQNVSVQLLEKLCSDAGYSNTLSQHDLTAIFDVKLALNAKVSLGSTHPDKVSALIRKQEQEIDFMFKEFVEISDKVRDALLSLKEWLPGKRTNP